MYSLICAIAPRQVKAIHGQVDHQVVVSRLDIDWLD